MNISAEKREGTRWREQLQSDLQLTVDWNRPDLAAEIFQQDFARVRVSTAWHHHTATHYETIHL